MSQSNNVKILNYTYSENDVIGKGSFGKVYKGKSITTGNVVAIKVMYVESNKQTTLIKMIKNEVDALKKVKNENVVEFLDSTTINNNVYIITEFCNQKDLRHYLLKYKTLDEKKAVFFLKQVINGFKELCKQMVFHRDIKPANILLHNGACKIADFGFAKNLEVPVTDYSSSMISIVGTPLYMSPQLLDKQKYSTKSDIWSLGIMLYEMLYGKVPWAGKDPATYSKNIKSQPLVIDHKSNRISADCEDFLRQCLKVNEEERIGWNELFTHPLVDDGQVSSRSTREDSKDGEFSGFFAPEKRIENYKKGPVHPSNLMKLYQDKILAASKDVMRSHNDLPITTIEQKLKQVNQLTLSQSIDGKANTNNHNSKTFNLSVNEDGKFNDTITKSGNENLLQINRFKTTYLQNSSNSPTVDNKSKGSFSKKYTDETQEEFKKIETPLLIMRNKLVVLSELHGTVAACDDFKELPTIKFNFLITISKLINSIFKNLSSQVLTKKIKTRSNLLSDYLETDNFKRLVAFVETNKKRFDEMIKSGSRKIFELNQLTDKEKDEVLEYYQEVFNEPEEQVLLGKLVDMANQMLYQIRFSSQVYRRSIGPTNNTHILESSSPSNYPKEYFEGLLALFGEDSILDTFKYDKIDEVMSKVEKLKEEVRQKA